MTTKNEAGLGGAIATLLRELRGTLRFRGGVNPDEVDRDVRARDMRRVRSLIRAIRILRAAENGADRG